MLGGKRYGPSSSRQRPHDRGGPSRDPATSGEREGARPSLRRQPHHGPEVAQAGDDGGRQDGAEAGPLDRPHARGGSRRRRVPAPHAPAPPRLPLRPSAHDPSPHEVSAASLPPAAWDQPAARNRGRQAREEALRPSY